MEKISLTRVFLFKKNNSEIRLADPDNTIPPQKVAVFYSNQYPEMLNASVTGPRYNDKGEAEYTISTVVGTKG